MNKTLDFKPFLKYFPCSPLAFLLFWVYLKKYKTKVLLSVICLYSTLNIVSIKQNEMHKNKTPIAVTRLQPELHAEVQPCNPGAEPPKKDAFTSTERCEELLNKRWLEEDRYHRLDDEVELRSQLLNKRFDEDLDVPSQRHHGFTSQSVIPTRKHHRIDEDGDFGRRYYRVDYDPETNAEMDPRFRSQSTYDRKTPRGFYAERYS